ncbi:transporter substrate-binding domain-containing protein [Vibrio pectenicida]|uniref:Transporter substrate-binding domain-containing protein n=1 Tax=Vibrio pectenicida TaxID=62763 RepID=A0A7Y4ECR9_9VIBR|nr:transporter substrate-binding domain-containing protein [Vibrio pectenicida]NOH70925.1 transporter substrate-binding domain-containing protein [Vibrio pectenicida]
MHHWLSFVLLSVLICPFSVVSEEKEFIKVAIGNIYRDQDQTSKFGIQVENDLKAIYKGAGLEAKFTYLPNERAIQSVIEGRYDALDMRVSRLEERKELIKVNVPLASFDVYLFSIEDKFYNSLDEAKDETIVSFHGTRYTKVLEDYKHLYLVHKAKQAALMLREGRVKLWLAPEVSYLFIKEQFPQIKVVSPMIARGNLYHYIHVSNSHLLPRLEASAKAYIKSKSPQN